jgi:hypothetical protein
MEGSSRRYSDCKGAELVNGWRPVLMRMSCSCKGATPADQWRSPAVHDATALRFSPARKKLMGTARIGFRRHGVQVHMVESQRRSGSDSGLLDKDTHQANATDACIARSSGRAATIAATASEERGVCVVGLRACACACAWRRDKSSGHAELEPSPRLEVSPTSSKARHTCREKPARRQQAVALCL